MNAHIIGHRVQDRAEMVFDDNGAGTIHYTQGYYWELCFGVVFHLLGLSIFALMTVFHVSNVLLFIINGSWTALVPFCLLVFWGMWLYVGLWLLIRVIILAPKSLVLNADGVWMETLYKPCSFGFFWVDIVDIKTSGRGPITLQLHTGYQYFYIKQEYKLTEPKRLLNRKYQQFSEYAVPSAYMKNLSRPQFELMLLHAYHRHTKNSLLHLNAKQFNKN